MKTKISDNLAKLRAVMNKSQQDFSAIFSIKRSTYSAYELGHVEPDLLTALKFAKYFGIKLEDLLLKDIDFKPSPPPSPMGMHCTKVVIQGTVMGRYDLFRYFKNHMSDEKRSISLADIDKGFSLSTREMVVTQVVQKNPDIWPIHSKVTIQW